MFKIHFNLDILFENYTYFWEKNSKIINICIFENCGEINRAQRTPTSKARATVKVDGLLQGNVQQQIREVEMCQARWGQVACKFGRMWTKNATTSNVVAGGNDDEWKQRFCVLLTKERRLLELNSWQV